MRKEKKMIKQIKDIISKASSATNLTLPVMGASALTKAVSSTIKKATNDEDAAKAIQVGVPAGLLAAGLASTAVAITSPIAIPAIMASALVTGAGAGLFFYKLSKNKNKIAAQMQKHGFKPLGDSLVCGIHTLPNKMMKKLEGTKSSLKETLTSKQEPEKKQISKALLQHAQKANT